jgi:7-dehydrocholesterol reductase
MQAVSATVAHDLAIQQERVGPKWLRQTLVPLCLIAVCPPSVLLVWHAHVDLNGSLLALLGEFTSAGFFSTLWSVWRPHLFGSSTSWAIIGSFAVVELILMRLLPGRRFEGPVTPTGNVPVYRANGVAAFVTTLALFVGGSFGLHLFPANIIYDHFADILGSLNLFSLLFCLVLYLKGRYAPSTSDHGLTGNPIFDYYWGTELYPEFVGWSLKMFTNCRFGMMGWALIIISFAAAQASEKAGGLSDSMVVAVAIQLVYITKFFWWETGYLGSLDIMHDRAGFYICWGCLVWVPGIYTSSTLYMVNHPNHLGVPLAALIFLAGVVSVFINYWADRQRQLVRATHGQVKVWGKTPVLLVGHYTTAKGERKESLLLASGWWGVARHFHYVPEVLGAFCWCLPALFDNLLAYFYVIFLVVLLTDRAFRDDNRCAAKYGADWEAYRKLVPWRIIPRIV